MSAIEGASKAVRAKYSGKGYIATRVAPLLSPQAAVGVVDVELKVTEGRKAFVRDVLIRGNRVTHDKVIRRELIVAPGDEYDG